MSHHAEIPFDVVGWDPAPEESPEKGPVHGRVIVTKKFSGDLEGESRAELLTCTADASDPSKGAGYVASEVFTGSLAGRHGTFAMQHIGLMGGGNPPTSRGHVIPGTGTGDLAGLVGEVEIKVDESGAHSLHLDYDFA